MTDALADNMEEPCMKWLKSKSYFYKILIYFGLVLLIPACTILLLYWQTDRLVKEQIQDSSRNTLNQFFRAVDIALEEAEGITISVMNSSECKEYARRAVHFEERLAYQAVVAQNALREYATGRYKDVLAYFPYCEKVVSGVNGSVDASHYFKVYFDTEHAEMQEQLDVILNCENRYPRLFSITGAEGETNLCVAAMVQNRGDSRQNYVAVTMISPKYLQDLLKDAEESLHGELLIYGEEKELLFSMGDIQIALPGGAGEKNISYEADEDHMKYMVWSEASEVLSGYYAYAIPYTYYWEQLRTIRLIFFWGFLGCVVLSIIVAYRLGNRAYMPVDRMMDFVKEKNEGDYDGKAASEFEFITAKMAEEWEEKQQLKGLVKSNKKVVSEYFVYQLLGGNLTEFSGRALFEKNGMEIYTPFFFTAVIVAEKTEHEHMLLFLLQNVFCELFDEKHKGYVIGLADRRYVLMVNFKSEPNLNECRETMERGRSFFWEKLGIALFIGVGGVKEGIDHIVDSYREATETLRYRYLYGSNCTLEYEQIKERQLRYEITTESKIFLRFMSYITGCEEQGSAADFTTALLKQHEIDENASIETVNLFKTKMIAAMNSILVSRNYRVEDKEEKLDAMAQAVTLKRFEVLLSELLDYLREQEETSESTENTICTRIRTYIHNHYSDSELNVEGIANYLEMSAIYISRCFKESYNVRIPDYIAQIRIQNAKEQLQNTEDSMGEIAERCGFLSSNVFIKTFKKLEGITPGAYRKVVGKED